MLIVVGGPQCRVGSHRQFVHLARLGASVGVPTLRFDCRGMGDSEGEPRTFEEMDDDIASAIGALCGHVPEVRHVVLCALCDGASAVLQYLQRRGPDPRVAGLILMNPWTRTTAGEAETRVRHYYRERLLSADFWRKLLTGGVARGALAEAWGAVRTTLTGRRRRAAAAEAPMHFLDRMAEGCLTFDGRLLLMTSGRDYTAKEFLLTCARDTRWQQVLARPSTRHVELPAADHTISSSADERELHRHCAQWLQEQAAEAAVR
jgi:exosortase A-associated hydrolase 1